MMQTILRLTRFHLRIIYLGIVDIGYDKKNSIIIVIIVTLNTKETRTQTLILCLVQVF